MFLTSIAGSERMQMTIFWLMGNLNMAAIENFHIIWICAALVITGILALFYISPQLNILSFGETDARTMGVNITRIRVTAFAVAALITAVAVSLSGLIGFVGLIVPHGVRLVFGPDHRQLVPLSAVSGAIFLVAADTIARIIVAPAQLPVGVITALVGGPFFLVLLVKYTQKVNWPGK
jgi:iron complex transport system permease protein